LDPADAEVICLLGIEEKEKIEADFDLFSQFILLLSDILKSKNQTEEYQQRANLQISFSLFQCKRIFSENASMVTGSGS
jgi:hypothetical protein